MAKPTPTKHMTTNHTIYRANPDGDDYPVHVYTHSTVVVTVTDPDGHPAAYSITIHQATDQDGGDVDLTDSETDLVLDEIIATYAAQTRAN